MVHRLLSTTTNTYETIINLNRFKTEQAMRSSNYANYFR